MANIFSNMTTEGLEETGDVLGGFQVYDTDTYEATVKVAYAGKSSGGAHFIGLHLDLGGKEYRENIYMTSKAGENFYVDKKTGAKKPMPGFTTIDDLCLLTTGEPLSAQEVEEKTIKLYNPETKTEEPTVVPVLTGVVGQPIVAAIQKTIEDKTDKATDANGQTIYVPNGETREQNNIAKFFHAETQGTVTEYKKDLKLGEFHEQWLNKNKGQVYNKAKGAAPGQGGAGGNAGAPGKPSGGAATKSLFNRK